MPCMVFSGWQSILTNITLFNFVLSLQKLNEVNIIIVIFQIRKLRLKELQFCAQDHKPL